MNGSHTVNVLNDKTDNNGIKMKNNGSKQSISRIQMEIIWLQTMSLQLLLLSSNPYLLQWKWIQQLQLKIQECSALQLSIQLLDYSTCSIFYIICIYITNGSISQNGWWTPLEAINTARQQIYFNFQQLTMAPMKPLLLTASVQLSGPGDLTLRPEPSRTHQWDLIGWLRWLTPTGTMCGKF